MATNAELTAKNTALETALNKSKEELEQANSQVTELTASLVAKEEALTQQAADLQSQQALVAEAKTEIERLSAQLKKLGGIEKESPIIIHGEQKYQLRFPKCMPPAALKNKEGKLLLKADQPITLKLLKEHDEIVRALLEIGFGGLIPYEPKEA
jgi:chromosome segregation ATPase